MVSGLGVISLAALVTALAPHRRWVTRGRARALRATEKEAASSSSSSSSPPPPPASSSSSSFDGFVEHVDGPLADYAPTRGFDRDAGLEDRFFFTRKRTRRPRLKRKLARGEAPLELYELEEAPAMEEAEKWPVVSVLIPTYNRVDMLEFALEAVAAQEYPTSRLEVVVVDDSTGGSTWDRLRASPGAQKLKGRLRYFSAPAGTRRQTIGAKRDFGVQKARGDVLCVWDDDDYFSPERLRASVAPIAAGDEEIIFINGAASMLTFSGRTGEFSQVRAEFAETVRLAPGGRQARYHGIRPRDICTVVYRRDLYVPGFYPDVDTGEDFQCFGKLRAIARSHGFVATPWVRFRHPESIIVQKGQDHAFYMGSSRSSHDMEPIPTRDAVQRARLPSKLLDYWLLNFVAPHQNSMTTLEAAFNLEAVKPPEEPDGDL